MFKPKIYSKIVVSKERIIKVSEMEEVDQKYNIQVQDELEVEKEKVGEHSSLEDAEIPMKTPPPLYYTDKPFEEALDPRVLEVWKRQSPYEQRTPGWYENRNKCITASSISAALMMTEEAIGYYRDCYDLQDTLKVNPKKNCSFKDSQLDLIMGKCGLGEPFSGNEFTLWGQKYEPVVSNVYSQLNQVDMLEFNLVFHPTIDFLAASPDGISTKGIMLEIKCPPCRQVRNYSSLYYFHQMILQLECCSLDQCDFMDCHFVEYLDEECWREEADVWENDNPNAKHHLFGIIVSYEEFDDRDGAMVMKNEYPNPLVVKVEQFLEWAKEKREDLEKEHENIVTTYYKLHEYYISRVRSSPKWVEDNLPVMQEVWNRILEGRTPEGYAALKAIKDGKEKKRIDNRKKKKENELKEVFLKLDEGKPPPVEYKQRDKKVVTNCLFDD